MALTVITAKYPPQIDLTRTPLAYGDRALPRLNRELNATTLLTRQRAVMSLCDYLHDPEHIASALREGIAQSLRKLLADPDLTVRHKSTECLYVMAMHAIGRQAFVDLDIIPSIAVLYDDKEDIVRKNAHLATEMCAEGPQGALGVVDAGLIPKLVKKLPVEVDEIRELILDTLHFCFALNTIEALDNEAMEIHNELLSHELPSIRAKAARNIMDLSRPFNGKDKAVEVQCMSTLVKLLSDPEADVQANAAGAIMMIAITTRGKYTAIEADAIPALVDLVKHDNSEVRANSLKALTCLSEAPEGRRALIEVVDMIRQLETDTIPAVAKAAITAVKVITWKP